MNDSAKTTQARDQFLAAYAQALTLFTTPPPGTSDGTGALVNAMIRTLTSNPEGFRALQTRFFDRQRALWERVAGDAPGHDSEPPSAAAPPDPRFSDPKWSTLPFFALLRDQYLLLSDWANALVETLDVPPAERRRIAFFVRQWTEAASPANALAFNPVAIHAALSSGGETLARGLRNLGQDLRRGRIMMSDETAFEVGGNLAVTPGAVVYENPLVQLIQYLPSTARVRSRPLLIVPPFINKFYVLDLRPENSFVRFAVDAGFRVFILSWRNTPPALGDASWSDYVEQGVLAPLQAVLHIAASRSANVLGFCVGGTLAACAAAVDAARDERRIASLTLLATLLDFSDPGDIAAYIDEAYVQQCEREAGPGRVVPGARLAQAFATLRARELIWHFVQHRYLLGETPPAFDLLYWNADSANLPSRLYAQYLRQMYASNALRRPGAVQVGHTPVDLGRIRIPAYFLAARDDHIVPWRSAFAGLGLLSGPRRFVLSESGHVAGIVNPPTPPRRGYWINERIDAGAQAWYDAAERRRGSWWPDWASWLRARSGRLAPAAERLGSSTYPPLERAPGRYVREGATGRTDKASTISNGSTRCRSET
jgi:polyhydroxyalkanoate synthase